MEKSLKLVKCRHCTKRFLTASHERNVKCTNCGKNINLSEKAKMKSR